MISLFRKQPVLLFDISNESVDDLINYHKEFISKCAYSIKKDSDISIAIEAFKHSTKTYNGSNMGDFLSYSEFNILKSVILKDCNDEDSLKERQVEIEHYLRQLKKFKVSLSTISTYQLSREDKKLIIDLTQQIQKNTELKIEVFTKKEIPFELLSLKTDYVKLVKRNKQYVFAVMLLHMYDYKHLHNFLNEGTR